MGRGDQPAPTCQGCPSAPVLAVPEARTPSRPVPKAHHSRGHPKVAETLPQPAPSPGLELSTQIPPRPLLPTPTLEAKSCPGWLRPCKLGDGIR